MTDNFYRSQRLPLYVFAEVTRSARRRGRELLTSAPVRQGWRPQASPP